MGFNTDKCKVMHLGRNNRHHTYRLGNSPLVSTEAEKDLGVIIDSKMNMGQQCGEAVRKADHTLSCIHRCISSRSKEVILPLYNVERVQRRATHMIKGQQGRPYKGRLQDLNLFSLHKRRLRGDLVACYKVVREGSAGIGGAPVPPSTARSDQE